MLTEQLPQTHKPPATPEQFGSQLTLQIGSMQQNAQFHNLSAEKTVPHSDIQNAAAKGIFMRPLGTSEEQPQSYLEQKSNFVFAPHANTYRPHPLPTSSQHSKLSYVKVAPAFLEDGSDSEELSDFGDDLVGQDEIEVILQSDTKRLGDYLFIYKPRLQKWQKQFCRLEQAGICSQEFYDCKFKRDLYAQLVKQIERRLIKSATRKRELKSVFPAAAQPSELNQGSSFHTQQHFSIRPAPSLLHSRGLAIGASGKRSAPDTI